MKGYAREPAPPKPLSSQRLEYKWQKCFHLLHQQLRLAGILLCFINKTLHFAPMLFSVFIGNLQDLKASEQSLRAKRSLPFSGSWISPQFNCSEQGDLPRWKEMPAFKTTACWKQIKVGDSKGISMDGVKVPAAKWKTTIFFFFYKALQRKEHVQQSEQSWFPTSIQEKHLPVTDLS